jgi:hypothetical protein
MVATAALAIAIAIGALVLCGYSLHAAPAQSNGGP